MDGNVCVCSKDHRDMGFTAFGAICVVGYMGWLLMRLRLDEGMEVGFLFTVTWLFTWKGIWRRGICMRYHEVR